MPPAELCPAIGATSRGKISGSGWRTACAARISPPSPDAARRAPPPSRPGSDPPRARTVAARAHTAAPAVSTIARTAHAATRRCLSFSIGSPSREARRDKPSARPAASPSALDVVGERFSGGRGHRANVGSARCPAIDYRSSQSPCRITPSLVVASRCPPAGSRAVPHVDRLDRHALFHGMRLRRGCQQEYGNPPKSCRPLTPS